MTPDTQQILRDSWAQLKPRGDEFAQLFYDRLFEQSPDAARLFDSSTMEEQRRKFLEMLEDVVHSLDQPEKLSSAVLELGYRHATYGVRDSHYPDVGATLLSAIDDMLGEDSSVQILDAWREAYSLLASVMQRGARQG